MSATKYYNIGLQYAKDANFDDAIEFLKKAIARDPRHVNSYNVLGKVYIQKGDILSARACWRKALRIDPTNETARQCLSYAKLRHLRIRWQTLIWLIIVAMLSAGLITTILIYRGYINDLEAEMVASAAKTAVSTPTSSDLPKLETGAQVAQVYNRALTDYRAGRYEEAKRGFQQILEYPPSHLLKDNAQYWLAECYYAEGKYDKALAEFLRVERYFPKSDKVFYAELKIAYTYRKLGQIESSRQKISQIVKRWSGEQYQEEIRLAKQELLTSSPD